MPNLLQFLRYIFITLLFGFIFIQGPKAENTHDFTTRFYGKIGNNVIKMTLVRKDKELGGSYSYIKIGKGIQLKGTIQGPIKNEVYVINEFDDKGNITGTFKGRKDPYGELEGQWSKPGTPKTIPFWISVDAGWVDSENEDQYDNIVPTILSQSMEGEDHVIIEKTKLKDNTEIDFPTIKGLTNPTVLKKVQASLSFQNIFNESLEEHIEQEAKQLEEEEKEHNLLGTYSNPSFRVNYNKNYILDVTFRMTFTGYREGAHFVHRTINLKTGEPLRAAEIFKSSMIKPLLELLKKLHNEEIEQAILDHKDHDPQVAEVFEGLEFRLNNLDNFIIDENGITFFYDYSFPYVIRALTPPGEFYFTYADLKPYINPDGPLGILLT